MKTISKALIAVMAAAAMCLVPLFAVADDSDAITVTSGEKAVSFKASSITDEKFNGLVTQAYKNYIADEAFNAIFPSPSDWTIVGDATVKNVKDTRMSLGNSVSESKLENVSASSITFDVVMTAKCNDILGTSLFELKDGTQDLYKELGLNTVEYNAQVTIEGTVTLEEYEYTEYTIAKNSTNDYVTKELFGKHSSSASFDGKVKVNALDKTYELKSKSETGGETTITPDYYNASKIEEVSKTSKVILNYKNDATTVEDEFSYKINGKSDSYSIKYDANALMGSDYMAGTVETLEAMFGGQIMLYFDTAISPVALSYYDEFGVPMTNCLFSYGTVSIADPTNDKVKNYLADIGTVSDEFSDAESVANGAYTPVSAPGNGGSGNNIVFYIIIGVLAVAVVALAVLMIKKK